MLLHQHKYIFLQNQTHGKCGKANLWFVKVLFLIAYFIINFFSAYYAHFYLICFLGQFLDFIAYTSICLTHLKTDVWNMW